MKKLILFAGLLAISGCIFGVTGCGNSEDVGTTKTDMEKGNSALPPDDGKGPGTAHGPPPSTGGGVNKGK